MSNNMIPVGPFMGSLNTESKAFEDIVVGDVIFSSPTRFGIVVYIRHEGPYWLLLSNGDQIAVSDEADEFVRIVPVVYP